MDEINLLEYVDILKRRWRIVTGITLSAVVICVIALRIIPSAYRAEAVLIFPPKKDGSLATQLSQLANIPLSLGGDYGSSPNLYTVILKSRTISEKVRRGTRLPADVSYRDLRDQLNVELSKDGSLTVAMEVPATWAAGKSKAEREHRAAQLASTLTNLYVTELQEFDQENALALGKDNREFVEGELTKTRNELSEAEERLQRFREKNPMVAPPDSVSKEFEQMLNLKTQQFECESALREVQHKVDSLRSAVEAEAATITSSEVITTNPVVATFKQRLADLEVTKATLLEKFTPEHPEVVDLDDQITKAQDRLKQEVERLVNSETKSINPIRQQVREQLIGAEVTKSGLEARNMALSVLMKRAEERLASQPVMQIKQMRLMRDLRALEALYSTLLTEYGKSRINESRDFKGFTVLDWAETPKSRSKPNVKLSLVAAIALGAMCGAMMAFVQEAVYRNSPKGRAKLGDADSIS